MYQLSLFDFGCSEEDSIFQSLNSMRVNEEIVFVNNKMKIKVTLNDRAIYEYFSDEFEGCSKNIQRVYKDILAHLC